ncbi:MAG TPA: fibro-slime domain-containing protein [Phycisphaerales bacterium]|nr:fibro-slime domain-containing protein [Phycisphaerales bacterium]
MRHTSVRWVMCMLVGAGCAAPALAQQGNGKGKQAGGDSSGGGEDPFDHLPDSIVLGGTVRDFRERHIPGGHSDFELKPARGFGHYVGMVAEGLDAEGRPAFASTGHKVLIPWQDAEGRPIAPLRSYIAMRTGDVHGAAEWQEGGAITTSGNFSQWFRDVPGVNMSDAFPITLHREAGTNTYVFDDSLDTSLASMEGFFIVNDKLAGNSKGGNKNYHFTYELRTRFVYEAGAGQTFTFRGDDDVWVFIDGRLVIDLGGVHTVLGQSIDLDRLVWLEDGETYPLDFFFAERHRTQSNCRIETNLHLEELNVPTASSLYD